MRINWIDVAAAQDRLGPLADRTGAVEGVVCLMAPELTQADGGPMYRECWFDLATGRFVDSKADIAYAITDVRGWALGWADLQRFAEAAA